MRISRVRPTAERKGDLCFVLDIGTDSVKAAVAHADGPRILGVGTATMPPLAMARGAVANIETVVDRCRSALATASDAAGCRPTHGMFGVGSELAHTVQIEARFVRGRPQSRITQAEWVRWQSEARAMALTAGAELPAHRTGLPVALEQLHEVVVSVYVDGHRVDDPRQFQGTYVQLIGVYAYVPTVHTSALRTVARRLRLRVIRLASPAWCMARHAAPLLAQGRDVILLDVGAGITDVALAGPDGSVATATVPYGGRDVTAAIQNHFGVSYDEAESIKLDYASGLIDAAVEHSVAAVLTGCMDSWVEHVNEAISSWTMDPGVVYVTGGGGGLPQLGSSLQLSGVPGQLPVKVWRPQETTALHDPQRYLSDEHHSTLYWLAASVAERTG